nr:hypothetical protein Itr_chr14CG23220 [Ipomoea trifida]
MKVVNNLTILHATKGRENLVDRSNNLTCNRNIAGENQRRSPDARPRPLFRVAGNRRLIRRSTEAGEAVLLRLRQASPSIRRRTEVRRSRGVDGSR